MSDRYNTFDDQEFEYCYPPSVFIRNSANIFWYYGDTLTINFDLNQITTENTTLELTPEFMEGKQVVFTFYNFRFEEFYTRTYVADEINSDTYTIAFVIDQETSALFKKGIYYCAVQIMDQDETDRNITTVMAAQDFVINVK